MKYVLVTGACGGMGRKAVEMLKNSGFFVIALDRELFEKQDNVLSVKADITNEEELKRAFEQVSKETGELFAVVHFAGIYLLDSLAEMKSEQFEKAFKVNLFGAFLVNKTFLPLMKSGSRIIITTSELAVLDPLPFTGIYAVTKAALDKYAYSLCMELQLLGITVCVLRAGAVDTGMLSVSTKALDSFCHNTKLYSCNAKRFRNIVEKVEARKVSPEKIAIKLQKILSCKRPKFAYSINKNPLLIMLNALPKKLQLLIIRIILK